MNQPVAVLPLETIDDNIESNEQLYDRHVQAEELMKSYRRRTESKPWCAELVLLNGGSGSGKTSLAEAFGKQVTAGLAGSSSAVFLAGKCQLKTGATAQPMPYAPFTQAFEQFSNQVMAESKETRENMKEIIEVVVGSEMPLLLQMLPCLKMILGIDDMKDMSESSDESTIMPKLAKKQGIEQQNQFAVVLRRFIRAVCCCGDKRALVLFVDDLQWASQATLDLISALVSPSLDNNEGLMVLGSCRGDEVSPEDSLSAVLRNLESKGTRITEIVVPNLSLGALTCLIGDTTNLPLEECEAIANATMKQTDGNPLYANQYMRRLEENRALYMDANDGVWAWDESLVEATSIVVAGGQDQSCLSYVAERMSALPLQVQEVVMTIAYLGGEIREVFISWALTDGEEEMKSRQNQVRKALRVGLEHGFWEYNWGSGKGKFVHDKFAEAATLLIPKEQQASFQLRLGRNLQKNAKEIVGVPKALPTFVHLILNGKTAIQCQSEKDELASLCLEAGRLMAKSSAFAAAIDHVINGINLLSENHWMTQYKLSLLLFNAAAELSYCSGDHDNVDKFASELKDNARCFEDSLQADITEILSLGSRGLNERAGALGMHALRKLGEAVPSKVSRTHVLLEVYNTRRLLRGKSDEEILSLPKMRDGRALGAMSLLHILYPIALMSHMEYLALISCRLICLTLQYGLCSFSSVGFAFYGSTLARAGNVQEGCRFGELSLKIIEKHKTKELMARALQRVGLNLRSYTEPLRYNIATMNEVKRLGMETGDIETAMYAAVTTCGCRFYSGDSLPSIARVTSHYIEESKQYGQHATSGLVRPLLQCCFNLMGKAAGDPLVLTGEAMDEKHFLEQARVKHHTGLLSFILMLKFVLATHLDDLENAESLSEQLRQLINRKHPPFIPIMWTIHQFYEGLVAIEIARSHGKASLLRNHYLRIARRRLKTLQGAASHCPENFMNKVLLLQADLEVCRGNFDIAESKYRQSIVFAEHEGFQSEQAMACERLARMLLVRDPKGNSSKSESYFKQARALYKKYGAVILVNRVTHELESVRAGEVPAQRKRKSPAKKTFYSGCLVPKLSEIDIQVGCY